MVSKIRGLEIKLIGYASYLRAVHQGVGISSGKFTLYLTLVTFVLAGNTLTPDTTFALSTLLHLLRHICALGYSQAIIAVNEATKSLKRITVSISLTHTIHVDKYTFSLIFFRSLNHVFFRIFYSWAKSNVPTTAFRTYAVAPRRGCIHNLRTESLSSL